MTVADLIRELQQMPPHTRVHVLIRSVYTRGLEQGFGGGHFDVPREQAGEVDDVRYEGQFVLIEGP